MIPVRDAIPAPTRPTVALVLAGTAAITYGAAALLAKTPIAWPLGLDDPGSLASAVAALFVPANWLQVAATVFALWIFGPTVEDRLGHDRFALLYLWCGAVGAGIAALAARGPVGVALGGPAAAVAGIAAGHLALYPRGGILVLVPDAGGIDVADVPSVLVAAFWLLVQLVASSPVLGALPGWSAGLALVHLAGGALAGAAGARVLRRSERMHPGWWTP